MPQVADLLRHATTTRDVLVYVHGFNQTFEAAALDAARLSDGIRFHGETLVFSWPSKAKLLDYGYDRESAMWSRDALEQVLAAVIASPASARIHIVAHSIGTMLTMEALRQIYARHAAAAVERVGAIVFAAPDIDMDVFTSSVERIGPLAAKITVVTATNDRALAVSGWIAGGITRVGAAEQAQLKQLGLHVIDASQQGWGVINHDLFLSNARIREVIRRAIDGRPVEGVRFTDDTQTARRDADHRRGTEPATGATRRNGGGLDRIPPEGAREAAGAPAINLPGALSFNALSFSVAVIEQSYGSHNLRRPLDRSSARGVPCGLVVGVSRSDAVLGVRR